MKHLLRSLIASLLATATAFAASPTFDTMTATTVTATTTLNAPSSFTLPIGKVSSLGTGIATWLGTPTSFNLAAALTNETGTGSAVFATQPSLTGPILVTGPLNITGAFGAVGIYRRDTLAAAWETYSTAGELTFRDVVNSADRLTISAAGAVAIPGTLTVGGSALQPLDSDLTAIAALTTTAFGRGLLDDADAATVRTTISAAASGANADITGMASVGTPMTGNIYMGDDVGVRWSTTGAERASIYYDKDHASGGELYLNGYRSIYLGPTDGSVAGFSIQLGAANGSVGTDYVYLPRQGTASAGATTKNSQILLFNTEYWNGSSRAWGGVDLYGSTDTSSNATLNIVPVNRSGNVSPTVALKVTGLIESTTAGFKFPDTTTQTSAGQPADADLTTWAGVTPGANVATFLATPSSANLAAAVTDESGSGASVFATSPTLVTPTLGVAAATAVNAGNGTSSNPAFAFSSDADMGMWKNGSVLRLQSATTEAFVDVSTGLFSGKDATMRFRTGYFSGVSDLSLQLYYGNAGLGVVSSAEWFGAAGDAKIFSVLSTGFRLDSGGLSVPKTITAGGTTGAQTINKVSGSVNFAAAAASLVVTNSLCATSSVIVCTVGTNDATMKSVAAVPGSGSFTLYPDAVPTTETKVFFILTN